MKSKMVDLGKDTNQAGKGSGGEAKRDQSWVTGVDRLVTDKLLESPGHGEAAEPAEQRRGVWTSWETCGQGKPWETWEVVQVRITGSCDPLNTS